MMRQLLIALIGVAALLGLGIRASRADGLIVVSNPPVVVPGHFSFAPLEVVYHKVDCTIDDQVAVTSVDQEFYNPNGGRPLEGEYIFPVPKDAQIDKFTMDIDGKPVEAELLPADKARGIYEKIVRESRDPALLEYAGRAMFKVRIFPIEANGRKHITLKYTELLKQDGGLLDYHYTLNTEKFSSKPLKNVSMKISVSSSEPLTTLYSPTHDVEINRHGERQATVGFEAKDIRPDTDFHLLIGRKATPVGISLMSYRPDADGPGYFVLLAAPTVGKEARGMPKDVVFVMDTSGSMSGAKIEQVRQALKYCIDTLNPTDGFDIVRFSTEAESFFGSIKQASDENRKKALEFAQGLKAGGGTAIDEALQKALDESTLPYNGPAPAHLRMIVFMTDGQPTVGEQNPDVILDHVKKEAAGVHVRVFSFGVGNDVNTKLLDLLAEQTRGYSQYVLPSENLELAMSNFWGKVQDPVLAGLKLDTGGVAVSKVYPREMPDLFKGDQLVVFGTYNKGAHGAVTITGEAGGKTQTFAQDVEFAESTDSSREWIAKLWATRRVGYLLDEIRLHGENKELKDEVVELSRRWGVVTPYTALLIIEDERRRNVPVSQRSLREMEMDQGALRAAGKGLSSLRQGEDTGGQAVANSVNGSGYKEAKSLAGAEAVYNQTDSRMHFENQEGAALARSSATAAPATVAKSGSLFTDSAATIAGRDAGSAPVPSDALKQLNLGTQTANGWQGAAPNAATGGYRMVTNYAQQTRVVNNRSFFLNGNQWTDFRVQDAQAAKHTKVVFNSDAYFDLLKAHPDAAGYLALGANVTVEIAGTIYDIVEETPAEKSEPRP